MTMTSCKLFDSTQELVFTVPPLRLDGDIDTASVYQSPAGTQSTALDDAQGAVRSPLSGECCLYCGTVAAALIQSHKHSGIGQPCEFVKSRRFPSCPIFLFQSTVVRNQ